MGKKIIYINGMPGAGKLTIANMIAQKTGAKVIDNHKINNLVFDIKSFNEEIPDFIWDSIDVIRNELYSVLSKIKQDNDYIFTGVTTNYDEETSFKSLKSLSSSLNSPIYYINLVCSRNELFNRIDTQERKNNNKLTCKNLYDEVFYDGILSIINTKNTFTLDNSNLTKEQTLEKVMEFLNT